LVIICRVDLRRLGYFVVLAEELNYRRAAERLHIAQPGLSQQIKVLEKELGATLFERSTAGVRLTGAGEVLLEEGSPLLRDVDRIANRVRAAQKGGAGLLRIVHTRSVAEGLPNDLVKAFRVLNPSAELAIESAWTAKNVEMLRAGEVDAAFIRLPLAEMTGIEVLPLGRTELVVALPTGHDLARKRTLRFADLEDVDVVSWPREQAEGYFEYVQSAVWGDKRPVVVASEPDPEHLLAAVASGVGVCVLDAERASRLRPRGVVIRRFARPSLTAEFGLAWNANRRSGLLDAFIRHCGPVGDAYRRASSAEHQ
jgi:DNA-binding transcriptional LysR family regulator